MILILNGQISPVISRNVKASRLMATPNFFKKLIFFKKRVRSKRRVVFGRFSRRHFPMKIIDAISRLMTTCLPTIEPKPKFIPPLPTLANAKDCYPFETKLGVMSRWFIGERVITTLGIPSRDHFSICANHPQSNF